MRCTLCRRFEARWKNGGETQRTFARLAALTTLLLIAGCDDKRGASEAQLGKAQELFLQGDAAQAQVAINDVLKSQPKNKAAHQLAGRISEALGDMSTAFVEYSRADLLDGSNHTMRIKIIDILVAANRLDAAEGQVNAALGDQPGNLEALARRGLVELRQGKSVKARVDASAVLVSAPGQAIACATLAELSLRDKRADLALATIGQGLKAHPSDPALLRLRAQSLLLQGDVPTAIDSYQVLLRDTPTSMGDRLTLAELQANEGLIADGEKTLRQGVAAFPLNGPLRLQLAAFLYRHAGVAPAQAELEIAIALSPKGSDFDIALADILARSGRLDAANHVLGMAIARVGKGASANAAKLALAKLLSTQDRLPEAQSELEEITNDDPMNDDALTLRAAISLRANDAAPAIADLLTITQRHPTVTEPFALLAEAYLQNGQTEDAIDAFRRVADLAPHDLGATLRFSAFCRRAAQPTCAQRAVDDFIARNPDSLEGRSIGIRFALVNKDWPSAQAGLVNLSRLPNSAGLAAVLQAEIHEAQGRFAEAASVYARLIQPPNTTVFDPKAAEAFVRSSLAAKRASQAVELLSTLARNTLLAVAVPANLALLDVFTKSGQSGDALKAGEAAIALAPADPAGYVRLAAFYRTTGRADDAKRTLDAGMAAGAPRAPLLLGRASLEQGEGKAEAAIETYRDILRQDPKSLVAANNLASLLAEQKPLDRAALVVARDALAELAHGDIASITDTIGWADYRLGEMATAKILLERAQVANPSDPQIKYHLGAALIALGQEAKGQALIHAVLDQDFPGHSEAKSLALN